MVEAKAGKREIAESARYQEESGRVTRDGGS
jgi:ssDNA-specific exonuclease RecJ